MPPLGKWAANLATQRNPPFCHVKIASIDTAPFVPLDCNHQSKNMSNRKLHSKGRTRAAAVVVLVCFLPLQIPRTCDCRILETPCASGCPCAAQNEVLRWQCSELAIAGTCEAGCSSDMVRHSHGNPKRKCRCKSGSPIAVTKITTSVEHDLECRILLDRGETVNRSNSPQSNISADSIPADGRYTSLERCVAMCRLTL